MIKNLYSGSLLYGFFFVLLFVFFIFGPMVLFLKFEEAFFFFLKEKKTSLQKSKGTPICFLEGLFTPSEWKIEAITGL